MKNMDLSSQTPPASPKPQKKIQIPRVRINADGGLDPRSEAAAIGLFEGLSQAAIGRKIAVCEKWAGLICKHPAVQARVKALMDVRATGAQDRLVALVPKAMTRLEQQFEMAESGELNFAQERALVSDTLDRTGFPRLTAKAVRHESRTTLSPVDIERLSIIGEAMIETGALAGIDFHALGRQIQDSIIEESTEATHGS